MDPSTITDIISTLGFPIVVAGALFWYINKKDENHKEEVKALRDTISDNTSILHELKELIHLIVKEK